MSSRRTSYKLLHCKVSSFPPVPEEFTVSHGVTSKARIGSKQNEVLFDTFGKSNMLANGQSIGNQDYPDERKAANAHTRLLNQIKTAARPFQRPALNFHTPTEIHVRAALYQIFDLDHRNNIVTISGYFHLWWIDPSLRWNASEFNNITRTFIPSKWFWKPELYLYHSAQDRVMDYAPDAVAEISVNGRLRVFIPITVRTLCPINVKHFPFDIQNCTFACGSWSYQYEYVSLVVDQQEVFLNDFYNSQEWLLENATISNGTVEYLEQESFSTVYMVLILRRESFYYVFNFVFPTTLVSIVAVIGFHAPINATGRHENKFRLGIITLLSMSVMLLVLVDEMKFVLKSIPGQRESFYNVPLLAVFHMVQMLIISVATCTSSVFVYLEKYALRNQYIEAIPWWLRFLSAKRLFCCYVPKRFRIASSEEIKRNQDVTTRFVSSASDSFTFRDIIPAEVNMTECHQETAVSEAVADAPPPINTQRIELLVNLMRQFIQLKEEAQRKHCLPAYWKRIIRRLENISLTTYLFLIITNVAMFMCHDLWY
ncbi:Neurotransmitter-gated ion-channel ligand binding domain family protein [Brugia pahangi]